MAASAAPANPAPRWRGFNLLYLFARNSDGVIVEDDFRWIADWGFDFVRLPMSYLHWVEDRDPYRIREATLARIDQAVDLGRRHGLHVCLNFHRAPGYSVNRESAEPFSLWRDQEALDAFCFHWRLFAERYRGVPAGELSFDLVNEPPAPSEDGPMSRADHERVVRAAAAAIRDVDPQRLVIMDGMRWGNECAPELADLGIYQSCRGYLPMGISHYGASWVDSKDYPEPVWPGGYGGRGQCWTRQTLQEHYALWVRLREQGVGVHCGECGCYSRTPHAVFLAWFRDVLEVLTEAGIGYALWNFRGSFGILDSGRADVAYEDWHGCRLDRRLLELLQEF